VDACIRVIVNDTNNNNSDDPLVLSFRHVYPGGGGSGFGWREFAPFGVCMFCSAGGKTQRGKPPLEIKINLKEKTSGKNVEKERERINGDIPYCCAGKQLRVIP
jgi:hypothetical protein